MKIIIIIISLFFVSSCGQTKDDTFTLDPSKPIEVGIESIGGDSQEVQIINVYMINHQPVRGIQLKVTPNNFFQIDSVYGGRVQDSNFEIPYNKEGMILSYSLSGNSIPVSDSAIKDQNILFKVLAKKINPFTGPVSLIPILADSSAKKLDFVTSPFELIGN